MPIFDLSNETKHFLKELLKPNHAEQSIKLEEINRKLDKLLTINKEIRLMNQQTIQLLGEIDAASTELAADIQALLDRAEAAGSLTAEEINAALAPKVEFLKQLAADTNKPVPEVPTPTVPVEG